MRLPQFHQFFDYRFVGLPGTAVWSTGKLVKTAVTFLLEAVDPLIGRLPGDAKSFGQFGNGIVVQLVVFEESLSLFSHGNTFPGL